MSLVYMNHHGVIWILEETVEGWEATEGNMSIAFEGTRPDFIEWFEKQGDLTLIGDL